MTTSKRNDPRRGRARLAALLLLGLSLSACEIERSWLRGTIGESYSLEFDGVRAYRIDDDLMVIFEKAYEVSHVETNLGNPVMNQIVRLTIDTLNPDLILGQPVEYDAIDGKTPIATVKRYVITINDKSEVVQGPDFPAVSTAELTLTEAGSQLNERVTGDFKCQFVSALTLEAHFETQLVSP